MGGEGEAVPFTIIDNGCPRYPALCGPVEQDFDKNRLRADMKAFRLDGSYDVQIQCTIMFCAGPNGCPPSNCLDSGNNELFTSHGRRKRRSIPASTMAAADQQQTAETLSAIIRVLAEGEHDEEVERFYNQTANNRVHYRMFNNKSSSGEPQLESVNDQLVCMADSWFVSMVASMSMVCLMLSALIVIWGCHWLQTGQSRKLPM